MVGQKNKELTNPVVREYVRGPHRWQSAPWTDPSSLSQDTAKCSTPDKGYLFPMAVPSTFARASGSLGCRQPDVAGPGLSCRKQGPAGAVLSLKATEGREQPAPALCEPRFPLSHRKRTPKHILGPLVRAVVLKQIDIGRTRRGFLCSHSLRHSCILSSINL